MGSWLRLLSFLLIVWEPLGLAPGIARLLPTLGDRGYGVALFLIVRVIVAGVAVAAGLAIWNRRAHAIGLAQVALVLSASCQLVALLTPILPTNLPPDRRLLAAAALFLYYAAWLAYLSRSGVRKSFG